MSDEKKTINIGPDLAGHRINQGSILPPKPVKVPMPPVQPTQGSRPAAPAKPPKGKQGA
ncbi:hypothetical protein AAFG07_11285 [Bradyrhizobium sp. B097]|uniref:hypothetical protein n=1 Tax=Bradyrhizobium sp. B097 TaxID=3140244 RepID=UPI00318404C6